MAFKFELCSPEKIIFEGLVSSISVPGEEGDMVILENHTPINTLVRPGSVVFQREEDSKNHYFFVRGALLIVRFEGVKLLAETILDLSSLDEISLSEQLKSAEEDMRDAKTEADRRDAEFKYHRLKEVFDALDSVKKNSDSKVH